MCHVLYIAISTVSLITHSICVGWCIWLLEPILFDKTGKIFRMPLVHFSIHTNYAGIVTGIFGFTKSPDDLVFDVRVDWLMLKVIYSCSQGLYGS